MSAVIKQLNKTKLRFHSSFANAIRFNSTINQMHTDLVTFTQFNESTSNDIYSITMTDMKTRNCLSTEMVDSLIHYIENASELTSNQCRVLILNSNRDSNVFCSGHNLKALLKTIQEGNEHEWQQHFIMCSNLLLSIQHSSLPIICCVHGVVTAAALEIASVADMILCTNDTSLCIPGLSIGVNACKPATIFSHSLNHHNWRLGLEMLLTGKETMIDAQTAYNKGYVNYVAHDYDDMNAAALKYASKIASKSKLCVSMGKANFHEQLKYKNDIEKAYECASKTMVDAMLSHDGKEGMTSFLNKTVPRWQDK
eukprot:1140084_1